MWICDGVCTLFGIAWEWWYFGIGIIIACAYLWVIDESDESGSEILAPFIILLWPIFLAILGVLTVFSLLIFVLRLPKRIYTRWRGQVDSL